MGTPVWGSRSANAAPLHQARYQGILDSIIIIITGFFTLSSETDETKRKGYAFQNGISILYGIARGVIASTTAHFGKGKMLLPTIMPQQVLESSEKTRKEKLEQSKGMEQVQNEPIKERKISGVHQQKLEVPKKEAATKATKKSSTDKTVTKDR